MLEYQNIKTLLQKIAFPNWSGELCGIKKVRNTVPWTYVVSDLNGKKIIGTCYEK